MAHPLVKIITPMSKSYPIKQYANKTWAIDSQELVYQAIRSPKYSEHENGYLLHYAKTVNRILSKEIKPVFVFDGTPVKSKSHVHAERKEKREKLKDRADTVMKQSEEIKVELTKIENEQKEIVEKKEKGIVETNIDVEYVLEAKRLLLASEVNQTKLQAQHYHRMATKVQRFHVSKITTMLNIMGIPWVSMPGDAENVCALLQRKNLVDCVYSQDSDALIFGSTIALRGWFGSHQDEEVSVLQLHRVLENLGLTYNQFIDFSILIGCDYSTEKVTYKHWKNVVELVKQHTTDSLLAHITQNQDLYKVSENYGQKFLDAKDVFLYYQNDQKIFQPQVKFDQRPDLQRLERFFEQMRIPQNLVKSEVGELLETLKRTNTNAPGTKHVLPITTFDASTFWATAPKRKDYD